jgi:hypothetical protein
VPKKSSAIIAITAATYGWNHCASKYSPWWRDCAGFLREPTAELLTALQVVESAVALN